MLPVPPSSGENWRGDVFQRKIITHSIPEFSTARLKKTRKKYRTAIVPIHQNRTFAKKRNDEQRKQARKKKKKF